MTPTGAGAVVGTGFLVTVDPATCAVSSLCVYRAGAVFDQDEEGHVVLLDPSPAPGVRDEVRRAARGCPTRSIRVTEDGVRTAPDPVADDHP